MPYHARATSSATQSQNPNPGALTDFGRRVILEMNRVGMLVDISHASDVTAVSAARTSRAPVIMSHSAVRAVANIGRNAPDDVLHEVVS